MSLTPEQQELRRTGIGGSEIAAVLGESSFASPFDVWLAKTQGWQQAETEDMRRGTYLEDGIARWYADSFGARVSELPTLRHAQSPIALCTPDRITETGKLVSIKSPRRGGDSWGPTGSDIVPPGYVLQLQWEHLVVSSVRQLSTDMDLAALVDGELRVYWFTADHELQAWMLDYAERWWRTHVTGGVPPSIDGSSQVTDWLRSRFPRDTAPIRPATPREDVLMLELQHAEREAARWGGEEEALRNSLRQSIGDAGGIESPAGRVTWKADKNGKRTLKTKWNERMES